MKNKFSVIVTSIAGLAFLLFSVLVSVYFLYPQPWLLSAAITLGTTAYHFLMRLAVGYGILKLTHYDFDYRSQWFQPRSWEPAFYKMLNIKHWKNKLPTYAPDQFSMTETPLHRIIQNMCGAEIVHETIMVLSFLPLVTVPVFGAFPVFFITSLLASVYDGIFVLIQRYNRPRLVRIYKKMEAKTRE